jgi:hypothetical protein
MKFIALLFFSFSLTLCYNQGAYKPKKSKKDFFGGGRDLRSLANYGFQVNFGATYTSPNKATTYTNNTYDIGTFDYTVTPTGLLGAYIDIGMAHFNVKKPILRIGKLYHYFDYGLNFKLFRGKQQTDVSYFDEAGREVGQTNGDGVFNNGYVGGRFTIHHLKYFNNGKKFLDIGLGTNVEYLVHIGSSSYQNNITLNDYFSNDLRAQLHTSLGLGFRLKRGSYLIPTVQVPILGFHEWSHESIRWFSSKYYPLMFGIKIIRLFEKKGNGCSDNGTEQDRKKNEEYLQGK